MATTLRQSDRLVERGIFTLFRQCVKQKIRVMTDAVTADFLPILAAAESPTRSFIVSIHDIAPITRAATEKALADVRAAGVRVTSLLVVPNYHHRGRSVDDATFVSWLRELEGDGHEVVLHGYFHERPRKDGERIHEKFLTRVYTQDEGEFFDLDYDEALARIVRGRDEMRNARLSPVGFVAPAWLLNTEGERAARDAEMQYTTRIASVLDLLTGEREATRSLVYSTRTAWRRAASLAWNAALARRLEIAQLVRMSIHPQDVASRKIWEHIISLVRRFSGTRKATTYRDWIGEQRTKEARP
ncbi:MAG TPA: polysaccharide deacetylase family protein [Chthoniobacterales bacterium]|jgi:hypothetical protein